MAFELWREMSRPLSRRKLRVEGLDGLLVEAGAGEHELGLTQRIADGLGHLAAAGVVLVHEQQPEHVAAVVLEVLPRAHVEDFLADRLGLIAHPLEAVDDGHQRRQRLERQLALSLQADQLGRQLVAQAIDVLLGLHRLLGQRHVLVDEGLDRGVQHRDGPAGDVRELLLGELVLDGGQHQDLPGHALGVVPDPLQLGVDLHRRVGEPQRAGHRLLADDELQAQPVELLLQLVDALVAHDHRIGELPVVLRQRFHAAFQRALGQIGHLPDLRPDALDVPLQGLFVVGHRLPVPLSAPHMSQVTGRLQRGVVRATGW